MTMFRNRDGINDSEVMLSACLPPHTLLEIVGIFNKQYCTANLTKTFFFVQEKYDLNVCSLFYGTAILYNGHEERLKKW